MAEKVMQAVISWAVPLLCGGVLGFLIAKSVELKAIKNGIQCLLRAEIIRCHEKSMERNYCPIYAKEALTRAYKAYHALKGNDVATELFEETMHLPTEPSEEGNNGTNNQSQRSSCCPRK